MEGFKMEKYSYFVIDQKNTKTGKRIASALRVHNCNNLLYYFKKYTYADMELISVNACDTWKEAQKIADHWNECARANGEYLFA